MKPLQVLAGCLLALCPVAHADTPAQRYKQRFLTIDRAVKLDLKVFTTSIADAFDPERTASLSPTIKAARQRAVRQLTPRRLKNLRSKLVQMRSITPIPKGWKEKDSWVDYYSGSLELMTRAYAKFDAATDEEIGTVVARVLRAEKIIMHELNLK